MRRAALLCVVALLTLLFVSPGRATEGFVYEWRSDRVLVRWSEGNQGPQDGATRREIGHWKRVAETLWRETPDAPPLTMDVTLYGPNMGSELPAIRLNVGSRSERIAGDFDEASVHAALLRLRDGDPPDDAAPPPPDDSHPRVSPDGAWISTISWRDGRGPEVWIASPDGATAYRVPPLDPSAPLLQRLIETPPEWSRERAELAWVQGGRVYWLNAQERTVRVITPAGQAVTELVWSPSPDRPLLASYDERRFDVLDQVRGIAAPIGQVLDDQAASGPFLWTEDGGALLFRTQTRIQRESLLRPEGWGALWDRFLALFGRGAPAGSRGAYEDRLAILDLARGRLDTVALTGSRLQNAAIVGALSRRAAEVIYLVARTPEGESIVVRLPWAAHVGSGEGQQPTEAHRSSETIWPVGWRTQAGSGAAGQFIAEATRAAFLEGERMLLLDPARGDEAAYPYPANDLTIAEMAPGPEGGFVGDEYAAALTPSEVGQRVWLESIGHTQGTPISARLAGGIHATVALGSPVTPALEALIRDGAAVDVDILDDLNGVLVAAMASVDGGTGQTILIAPREGSASEVLQTPLSLLVSQATPQQLDAVDQPHQPVDVYEGLRSFTSRRQRSNPAAIVPAALALVAFLLIAWIWRRRESEARAAK